METFDLQELFELWKEGKSINEAIEIFIDCKKIKQEVRKKLKNSETITEVKSTGFLSKKEKQKQDEILFLEYEKEIFRKLYKKIKSEEILAIGYLEPIGGSDTPELISQMCFPPDEISLELSSIVYKGNKYSNIRIVENPKMDIDFSKFDTKALSPGRSTREPEIIEAYEYLKKQDKIDYSTSFDSQIMKIRKAVWHLHPDITDSKGLSDKTINKHLSSLFQKEKKALKNNSQN